MIEPTETQEYKDLQRQFAELNKSLRQLERDYNALAGAAREVIELADMGISALLQQPEVIDDLRKALEK
jgi:molecular chaperone GrpE (heat shock protein)